MMKKWPSHRKTVVATLALATVLVLSACGGTITEAETNTDAGGGTTATTLPTAWVGTWVFSVNDTIGHCETEYQLKDGGKARAGRYTYVIQENGNFTFTETLWPQSSCDKMTNGKNADGTDAFSSISQLESEKIGTIIYKGKFINYTPKIVPVHDSGGNVTGELRTAGFFQSQHDVTATTFSTGLSALLANPAVIRRADQKHTAGNNSGKDPLGITKETFCTIDRSLDKEYATIIGNKNDPNGGDWHCHFISV